MVLLGNLAHLQKDAAELQVRLTSWSVETAEDRNAVREDIQKLEWHFSRLLSEVGIENDC